MPLDSNIRRMLDMFAATASANVQAGRVAARRDAFRKLMSLADDAAPIGAVENRTLPGPDGPLPIRIYSPLAPGGDTLPGLIYFHGGGLVAGDLDSHEGVCRSLAGESGCRLVAVDYRLAPEHPFPAAVRDAYAATARVVERAEDMGIDRDRLAVGGDSAGATLAAVVCQLARKSGEFPLAAQLLLCPIMDFAGVTQSRRAFSSGFLLEEETMARDLQDYVPPGVDIRDPRISPLRATDVSGLPPACIHTAEFDPLRDEGEAYGDRLNHAGVPTRYTCHPGMIHLFYAMSKVVPYAQSAMRQIGAELRAALD